MSTTILAIVGIGTAEVIVARLPDAQRFRLCHRRALSIRSQGHLCFYSSRKEVHRYKNVRRHNAGDHRWPSTR